MVLFFSSRPQGMKPLDGESGKVTADRAGLVTIPSVKLRPVATAVLTIAR
jgi:hypothetical protein